MATEDVAEQSRRRTCLLVLGMHRSGTSALSGTLAALGAKPPRRPLPASEDNPKGFFESMEIVAIHDRMLAQVESHWFDWRSIGARISKLGAYRDELVDASREEFGDADIFVVKDPRICRFVPLWLDVAEGLSADVIAVHIYRDPMEVSASLRVRNDLDESFTLLAWLRHTIDAERTTRHLRRYFLSYAGLVESPTSEILPLLRILKLDTSDLSPQARATIEAFVDPNLKRQKSSSKRSGSLGAWLRETYEAVESLKENPYNRVAMDKLDFLHSQLEAASEIFEPSHATLVKKINGLERDLLETRGIQSERDALVRSLDEMSRIAERVPLLDRAIAEAAERMKWLAQKADATDALAQELEGTRNELDKKAAELQAIELVRLRLIAVEKELKIKRAAYDALPALLAERDRFASQLALADVLVKQLPDFGQDSARQEEARQIAVPKVSVKRNLGLRLLMRCVGVRSQ